MSTEAWLVLMLGNVLVVAVATMRRRIAVLEADVRELRSKTGKEPR